MKRGLDVDSRGLFSYTRRSMMKHSLRLKTFLAVSSLGLFAACGQSPEEKAMEEDTQLMVESAPLFTEHLPAEALLVDAQSAPPPVLKAPGEIRVKVYPHLGRYNTPHGKEAHPERVTVQSDADCSMSDGRGVLGRGKKWVFTTSNLAKTVTISCDAPIEVKRGAGSSGALLESRKYSGKLEVSVKVLSGKKIVQIVNRIGLEDYLKGVVPSEMPVHWNLEALKVQAVAARSYSLSLIQDRRRGKSSQDGFDVDDTVLFQAYKGLNEATKNTNSAVNLTRGEVMVHQGRVVQAYFSADAGGFTESAKNAWGTDLGFAQAKKEPFPWTSLPVTAWRKAVSKIRLNDLLNLTGLSAGTGVVNLNIYASQLNSSGRVKSVQVMNSAGKTKNLSVAKVERVGLRSRLFKISSNNPTVISGRGYGHGVGLSQWGARLLTQAPYLWNYRKVLEYYYSDSDLVPLK
jgi:stage II sporulation protein D